MYLFAPGKASLKYCGETNFIDGTYSHPNFASSPNSSILQELMSNHSLEYFKTHPSGLIEFLGKTAFSL